MRVQLPNGQIIDGIPEGTTKEQIQEKAIKAGLAKPEDFGAASQPADAFKESMTAEDYAERYGYQPDIYGLIKPAAPKPEASFGEKALGVGEAALTAVSGATLGTAGMIAGTLKGLSEEIRSGQFGTADAANRIEDFAAKLAVQGTYEPRTPKGQEYVKALGQAGEALAPLAGLGGEMAMIGQAGRMAGAQVAAKPIAYAGKTYDDVTSMLKTETDKSQELGTALQKAKRKKIVPELMADKEVIAAADRLGVDLNPGHYSTSDIYREYEIGLKMIPGSRLSEREKNAVRTLATRADELITEIGGTTDKGALSESVKARMASSIDSIKAEENVIYDAVESAIPKSQRVIPRNTLEYLRNRADEVGGVKFLSPAEKAVYKALGGTGEERPTFQRLVEARRNVHSPSGMNNPFANTDKRTRDMLYNAIKSDERGVIGFFDKELLADYDRALEIGAKRFALQDEMVSVFGKDLSKSLFTGMKSGVRGLASGDVSAFRKVMDRVPEDMRETVAATALNDVFTAGARTAKDLSMSGFVNAYAGIKRNSNSFAELSKYVPPEAISRLDDMYKVIRGIEEANRKDLNNSSGSARAVIAAMDNPETLLHKVYSTGAKAAAAESLSTPVGLPGAGAVGVIISSVRSGSKKATQAADEMLTSPAFKKAVSDYLKGQEEKGNRTLETSPQYRRWLGNVDPQVKREILRQGALSYLIREEEE